MKRKKLPEPVTLEKEKLLYNILCEALAERLFFYFHGSIHFDYDDNGDGAFVECNLHLLFSTFCLYLSGEYAREARIHMSVKGEMCEISFALPEGARLDEKQIFENASLGAMMYERCQDGFSLLLPVSYEAVLPLFANHETILQKLDALAKLFEIL